MSWEQRVYTLEQRVEYVLRYLQDLLDQIRAAAQNARNAYAQAQPGGTGGSGVYFCLPTSLAGATGTWPSLTPGSQSLAVYQVNAGALVSVGTATVYNFYPAATSASLVLSVTPNGDGTFSAVAQSCT
jgi:hypothetical protein